MGNFNRSDNKSQVHSDTTAHNNGTLPEGNDGKTSAQRAAELRKAQKAASETIEPQAKRKRGRPPTAKDHVRKMFRLVESYEKLYGNDHCTYLELRENDSKKLLPISGRSSPFVRWIRIAFENRYDTVPDVKAINDFVAQMDARASVGKEIELCTRIGVYGNTLYLDLCNDAYEAVAINAEGWQVVRDYPVYFRRTDAMQALPHPQRDGSIRDLLELFPVEHASSEAKMLLSWLVQVFLPNGEYCPLVISGEPGTAKSSLTKLLKNIVDPNIAPYSSAYTKEQNLVLNAQNNRIVAYDNLLYISGALSDIFCKFSTGHGFNTRKLYSDSEEVVMHIARPMILNCISVAVNRSDLVDRSMFIELKPIAPEDRLPGFALQRRFAERHARALGVLLNAVSCAMRNEQVVQDNMVIRPRMLNAAIWIEAATEAFGYSPGTLLDEYINNSGLAMGNVLENSVIGQAIVKCLDNAQQRIMLRGGMRAQDLYEMFWEATQLDMGGGYFPKNHEALIGELRRLAPALRTRNIYVTPGEHTMRGNITRIEQKSKD